MVTLVKPVQSENARLPIEMTELGIVTLVSPKEFQNARFAIPLVPSFRRMLVPLGIFPL